MNDSEAYVFVRRICACFHWPQPMNSNTHSIGIFPHHSEWYVQWMLFSLVAFLPSTWLHSGGRMAYRKLIYVLPLSPDCTDKDDRLIRVGFDHKLFLVNTNFCHENLYCLIWFPSPPSQHCAQINHIAVGYQWVNESRTVDHSDPHRWTQIIPCLLLFGPSPWWHQLVLHNQFHILIVDFSSNGNFNAVSISMTFPGSKLTLKADQGNPNSAEVPYRTPWYVDLRNGGHLLLQLICWVLADPSPGMPHTTKRVNPWEVHWPGAWKMTPSSGGLQSVRKWKMLRLSAIVLNWVWVLIHWSNWKRRNQGIQHLANSLSGALGRKLGSS